LSNRLVTFVLVVHKFTQGVDRYFKVFMFFPQHFYHLYAYIVFLFKSLFLYLFFQIRDAFE
jgi:hypothetical protein